MTVSRDIILTERSYPQALVIAAAHVASSVGNVVYPQTYVAKASGAAQATPFVLAASVSCLGIAALRSALAVPVSVELEVRQAPIGAPRE